MVRRMSHRLSNSEITFSPQILIPMLERYAVEFQNMVGPTTWLPELFIDVGFPFETIISVLQGMWWNNIAPFTDRRKRILVLHILYVISQWYEDCIKTNMRLFGSDENARDVAEFLDQLHDQASDMTPQDMQTCMDLKRRIERAFR
jgi:nuclear pore complex protein Nup155